MKKFIQDRKIERIIHFTTNIGLVGILNTNLVKSRKGLCEDDYLSHIVHNNCLYRKDIEWIDFISMSIQEPNNMFFQYSSKWPHNRNFWWCVLSFKVEIITHAGVVFCTTNNSYDTVIRGSGVDGLKALYANRVAEKHPYFKVRDARTPPASTTSPQAEILYPRELSLDFLETIYFPNTKAEDDAMAYIAGAQQKKFQLKVDSSLFI